MGQQQMPAQTFIPSNKNNSEKEKAMKELEISSSEKKPITKSEDTEPIVETKTKPKTLISNINETIFAVILYALISNPFITPFIVQHIPFFETSPSALFGVKVILFAIIYHLVRWLM